MKYIVAALILTFFYGSVSSQSNDAEVIQIGSSSTLCQGTNDLYLEVSNIGSNQIDSLEVFWEINGGAQSQIHYKQLIDTANGNASDTASILIGSINLNAGNNDIKIWTTNPNGVSDSDPSNDTLNATLAVALSGGYTIDASLSPGGGNFQSFTDFALTLDSFGVCGAVNVSVAAGVYNESVTFGQVSGASSSNTISIDGGDSSQVKLISTSANAGTLILDSAKHFVFKNMTIENTGTSNAAVLFAPMAYYNEIANCELRVASSSSAASIVVAYSGNTTASNGFSSDASYNLFKDNRLVNGHTGFGFPDLGVGNKVIGNRIDSVYQQGIKGFNQDSLEVIGNYVDAVTAGNSGSFGVYFQNYVNSVFNQNYIHAASYGVASFAFSLPSGTVQERKYEMINNMVVCEDGNGFYITGMDSVAFYHNSVSVHGSSAAFNISSVTDFDIRNNIFDGGSAAAFSSGDPTTSFSFFDYNIYHTTGSSLATLNSTNYSDLTAIQAAYSSMNQFSLEGDPKFVSATDLHISSQGFLAGGAADNSVNVSVDFDGEPRPQPVSSTPDIGADEFTPPTLNLTVSELIEPSGLICPTTVLPVLVVTNNGLDTINTFSLIYAVNSQYDTINFSGTILPSDTANISLDSLAINANVQYDLLIYSENPNGNQDNFTGDDTLRLSLQAGLSGNYTIDGSGIGDYISFTEAVTAMEDYGVCGAVTFDVASGVYNEAIEIGSIEGVSSVNRVTFSGSAASNTILTSNSTNDATLWLDEGVSYFNFDNLSILSTANDNSAILLESEANYNTFSDCIIRVPEANISSPSSSIAILVKLKSSYNLFEDNTIRKGTYGLKIEGTASEHGFKNQVIRNDFDSVYQYTLHVDYQDSILISENEITATSANSSGFVFGAYLSNSVNVDFNRNNIISKTYGAMIQNFGIPDSAVRSSKYRIVNNMIYSSGYYGVWIQGVDSVDIFHNSISTGANTSALRIDPSSNTIGDYDVRNNILVSLGGDAIEVGDTISIFSNLDYNLYESGGSSIADIDGTTYSDITAFKLAITTLNMNSIEGDPEFVSTTDLHINGSFVDNVGDNTVGVQIDIDGDQRPLPNSPSVDIGADEFYAPICQIPNQLTVSDISLDSISISWNDTINNEYEYQVVECGITPDTSYFTVNDSIRFGGLTQGQCYEVYVRNICDRGDSSVWTSPVSFTMKSLGNIIGTDTICSGATEIISTSSTCDSIQWQERINGTWVSIVGETDSTLSITPLTQAEYRVLVCDSTPADSIVVYPFAVSNPSVVGDTTIVNCGDTGTIVLTASSIASNTFAWFDAPSGGNRILNDSAHTLSDDGDSLRYTGSTLGTSPDSVTFYVEEVSSIKGNRDTLTAVPFTGGSSCNGGNMFDLVPKTDMNVNGFILNSYTSGWQTVDVYIKQGTYLTSTSSPNDWTLVESVNVYGNGTGNESLLELDSSINLDAFDTVGVYIDYDANYTNAPLGTVYSNIDLDLVGGYGFCTPFSSGNAGRAFNGRVLYSKGCTSARIPVKGLIDCTVGINESVMESGISIYPNPSTGLFTIEVGAELEDDFEFIVRDVSGKVVYNQNHSINQQAQKFNLNLNSFSKGIYFLHIRSAKNGERVEKLIIQ